ncbi:MAG: M13 family metallopeptidase [Bacteroidaceae bacterium]|nr:M13 family metallopeptidase [Bacteroidaceae bacterium]
MKKKHLIMAFALTAMAAACTPSGKQLASGIDLANLDSTYLPGTDFYMYATGGWQKLHPLTAEYSRFGSFDQLQEDNNERLRSLIDSVAAQENKKGSVEQKIADLYNSVMDSARLNSDGLADAYDFLACFHFEEEVVPPRDEDVRNWLENVWPRMQRQGVPGLFGMYIAADEKDAKNNIVTIVQGGLTLGQKDYYVDKDARSEEIRKAYREYIIDLCQHFSFSEPDYTQMAEDVLRIETRIAEASKSRTELRDPEDNYNKLTYKELKEQFPGIHWDGFFQLFGMNGVKEVCLGQPVAIHEVEKILKEETQESLRNIYLWHAMDMAASCIDDASRALSFNFYGKVMSGKEEDRPRWKRAVAAVEGGLGEALGQLYVAKYFPPEAKKRMEKLINNLQIALGERIDVQEWMSDETKKVAREKLDAFYVKVGYPDKWKDYSDLEIGESYLRNILAVGEWEIKDMIKTKFNKPVDRDEWYMTPQTVNAYYNPTTNEICFPAGILQPPFFDMQADDAFNYGAIGVVIGHEMTHGFDDNGSKYDKNGNLVTWWSEEDRKEFEERIQVMRAFHDSIEVMPGLHANGSLTLGENMADHGGLMVAFQAFKNATASNPLPVIDGFTPEQRFFLAYANVWGQNIRDEEIQKRVKGDPHQLGMWRVNGQMPHIDAWYDAFGITEADPMFVPKEKRVTIW